MTEELILCELYAGPYDGREVYISRKAWLMGYEIEHSRPMTFAEFEALEHGETIPMTVAIYFARVNKDSTIQYGFGVEIPTAICNAKGLPIMSYGGTIRK